MKLAALVLLLAALAVLTLPAYSATSGTWMGQVAYINARHIGVKAMSQTRDFVLDSNTKFLSNGNTASASDIKTGMTVTVSFDQGTLFGSTHATSVEVKSFTFAPPTATSSASP